MHKGENFRWAIKNATWLLIYIFEISKLFRVGASSYPTRCLTSSQSFITCCNKCPMQDSGLMGKWEMGYHQANRAPQSTNQIRKLGVCVSKSKNVRVCVCLNACVRWGWPLKLSGALIAVLFQEVADSGEF